MWARSVRISLIEDRLHQGVAAGNHVADDPDIRAKRTLVGRVAFDQFDTQRLQLVAHGRIHVGVAPGHPVAGRLGEGGNPSHESAANAENMQVFRSHPQKTCS